MIICNLDDIHASQELLELRGIVYMIINTQNDKMYIGRTSLSFIERYGLNFTNCYNKDLKRDIVAYGKDSFIVIIYTHDTQSISELDILEQKLIFDYQTMNGLYGYNKTSGGVNGKLANGTKDKISKALRGSGNPMFGKKGANHPKWGKKANEETRQRQRINHANVFGGNNPMARKSAIIIDNEIIIKDTRNELINHIKERFGISIESAFKKRGLAKKYKDRISFCGNLEDMNKK